MSVGVSAKKEDRATLSTSEKLKLTRTTEEEGDDKFMFFKWNG